jgi:uncharacterized membrane protein
MKYTLIPPLILLMFLLILLCFVGVVHAEQPVVHALLFYSPSCAHCHKVITETLPPILEEYGEQVAILGINTYTEEGNDLFLKALDYYNIPRETAGVPMLVIGETVLVGSLDIPGQLPGAIAAGLSAGGIDWPSIPGLAQLLQEEGIAEPESTPEDQEVEIEQTEPGVPNNELNTTGVQTALRQEVDNKSSGSSTIYGDLSASIASAEILSLGERFMQDRTGNLISTLVLAGMVFSVVFGGVMVYRSSRAPAQWPNWIMTLLLVVGTGVAVYMAYVEVTDSVAVCGPVGDCNTVQQSEYASLFGLIPIGLLGVVGYVVLSYLWIVSVYGQRRWQRLSLVALWGFSLTGTLFSIYLTFLEPFVIGATCAWCLTSAVVMTLIFWAATASVLHNGGLSFLGRRIQ